jgi:hypothetical protein
MTGEEARIIGILIKANLLENILDFVVPMPYALSKAI